MFICVVADLMSGDEERVLISDDAVERVLGRKPVVVGTLDKIVKQNQLALPANLQRQPAVEALSKLRLGIPEDVRVIEGAVTLGLGIGRIRVSESYEILVRIQAPPGEERILIDLAIIPFQGRKYGYLVFGDLHWPRIRFQEDGSVLIEDAARE